MGSSGRIRETVQNFQIRILIENLLARVVSDVNGGMHLPGVLTNCELQALRAVTAKLGDPVAESCDPEFAPVVTSIPFDADYEEPAAPKPVTVENIELDRSVLDMPPVEGMRLCLDFGTAMSKATLVQDGDLEQIHVLELGRPGDQEEISAVMLISSVYIDNNGRIWFGKSAVDRSLLEGGDGSRQRLDNIKRRLSEDGFDEIVSPLFNPSSISVTYGEMILAYLMFMTWATNRALEEEGYPRNIPRRFAMPCFPSGKSREVSHTLRRLLGDAQILADTFSSTITSGIPVSDFAKAITTLRKSRPSSYPFVTEDLTEPLGVAGALLSWQNRVDMLAMVIDVGAGTSDLSLYRILVDPSRKLNAAHEVLGSTRGITEAGNYLDGVLVEFFLKKACITSSDPHWIAARSKLLLNIRDYKETLFNDGFVFITLPNVGDVQVELDEFKEIDAVRGFGKSLKDAMTEILESVDASFVDWILASPSRYLTVALTGGGASLPMVQELARGVINVRGRTVPIQAALPFPRWLQDEYPELEVDFARIAVSLGGARKQLVQRGANASITGGDVPHTPILQGYYQKGGS